MFCKTCGQMIDNDSKFCKHCGTSLVVGVSAPPAAKPHNVAPPVGISHAELYLAGPAKTENRGLGGWGGTWIGRGIMIEVGLVDGVLQPTSGEGELICAIMNPWGHDTGGYPHDQVLDSTEKQARRVARDKRTIWYKSIGLSQSEFHWYQNGADEVFVYRLQQLEPLVMGAMFATRYLHVWLLLPNGKCLYKPQGGGGTSWKP